MPLLQITPQVVDWLQSMSANLQNIQASVPEPARAQALQNWQGMWQQGLRQYGLPASLPVPPVSPTSSAPSGTAPFLPDIQSILMSTPTTPLELENKKVILDFLARQRGIDVQQQLGTGQLGLTAAQIEAQQRALSGPGAAGGPSVPAQLAGGPENLGFRPPTPGTVTSQGQQEFINPQTGQRVTVPTGGYTPPPGWVRINAAITPGTPSETRQPPPSGTPPTTALPPAPPAFRGPLVPGVSATQAPAQPALQPGQPAGPVAAATNALRQIGVTVPPGAVQPAQPAPPPLTEQPGLAPTAPPRRFVQHSTSQGNAVYEVDSRGNILQYLGSGLAPLAILAAAGITNDDLVAGRATLATSPEGYTSISQRTGNLIPFIFSMQNGMLTFSLGNPAPYHSVYGDITAQQQAYQQYQQNLQRPVTQILPGTTGTTLNPAALPTIRPLQVTPNVLTRLQPSEQAALANLIEEQGQYTIPDFLELNRRAFLGFGSGRQQGAAPRFLSSGAFA